MNVRAELEAKGCLYTGHFVGTSGKHLAGYCNLDPIFPHVEIVSQIALEMVKPYAGQNVDTVIAPATGAIPLSQWGAYHLGKLSGKKILGVWADKAKPDGFEFERSGFLEAVKGKRVIVLEDMVNQMFSIRKVVALVRDSGGELVGVGAIAANKGVSAEAIGTPKLVKLCDIHFDVWTPEDCKKEGLCHQKVPIVTDIGHGHEFMADNPGYPGGYTKLR